MAVRREATEQHGQHPDPFTSQVKQLKISMGGPHERRQQEGPPAGGAGWNAGDIDFREDGAIFIRNPYLADAIEKFLKSNWEELNKEPKDRTRKKLEHFLRIVRDEGWSGNETNVVC